MEENLNLIELIETLKKNKSRRFFERKSNITQIAIIIAYELSSLATGSIPYIAFVNILVPLIIKKLYQNWRQLDDVRDILTEEIRKTSDYQDCIELYNEYIKKLADFISKFNLESAKEIVFFFDVLLTNGFLSSSFKNVYKNYEYDKNYIVETLGARTLSGASVCRHMSALAADCFSELGNKAEILTVSSAESIENLNSIKDFKKLQWSHGVVGIADNNHKFIYDPTISRLCGKSEDSNQELEKYIAEVSFVTTKAYQIIKPHQYSFSKKHNNLQELCRLPLETLDKDEIMAIRKKIVDIFVINEALAYNFAIENLNLTKEISNLEAKICPHSDSPILKWQLKK